MPDVLANFIKPMIALYGEPAGDDQELVFNVYRKTLNGYRDEDLKAGFQIVADTYIPSKRAPWPTPAICRKACEQAAQQRLKTQGAEGPKVSLPPVQRAPYDEATLERWELAAKWREKTIAEYGSVDAYLLKHRPTQMGAA